MTTEELLKILKAAGHDLNALPTTVIGNGTLRSSCGEDKDYTIFTGWNIKSASECQNLWEAHNLELFKFIEEQEFCDEELASTLESIQTEDAHWDWVGKSCRFKGDEYRWFYLYADDKPQGACLIYQPKSSALTKLNIFYVEFLAVAPWNRTCNVRQRDYFEVGSIILKAVLKFATKELGLKPGFSLHSLPQANAYYQKLKMVNIEAKNKGEMLYFELPHTDAEQLLEEL